MAISDAVRQIGVTEPMYYRGRKKYGGLKRYQLKHLQDHDTAHNLLLALKYSERPEHIYDGKIIVMRSNLRWCSDGFEFTRLGTATSSGTLLSSMPMTARSSPGGLWSTHRSRCRRSDHPRSRSG